MKRFKTLIVEDNNTEMKYLVDLLKDHQDIIEISGQAESYSNALSLLGDNEYDLSILDYKLDNHKTLFNLVESAKRKKFGLIVYTSMVTSNDIEKILDVKPDFRLYKPFDEDSVGEFVLKLKKHVEESKNSQIDYMVFTDKELKIKVPYKDIYYLEGARSSCSFICKGKVQNKPITYIDTEGGIGTFDYLLNTGIFVKCMRSYYINKHLIKAVKKSSKEIIFEFDHSIPPVPYADWFIGWLNENGY